MNAQWAKTRSGRAWHIVRETFDWSLCGRSIKVDTIRDDRPGHEKTCESCLRIVAPK